MTVVLAGEGWTVTAAMNAERVLVESGPDTPPFSMPVPPQTVVDTVVADLRELGRDMYLRQTVLALAE